MVKINCKVKAKYNYKKIQELQKRLPETIKNSVEDIINSIRGYAIKLERGHHDNGILCELVDISNNNIKGRVYADINAFPFFLFEYYGTGQYAEMEHIGKTKHFLESGYTEWFIPVSAVERTLHFPIVTINDMQFYIAHGVKANHFMTDAEFETRETNKKILEKNIKTMLKEVCK